MAITGYAIRSRDGALDPVGLTPLAASDPDWIRLSAPDETQVIAEGHLNQAVIPAGSELSIGDGWARYFREVDDLSFEYLDADNEIVEAILRFDDTIPGFGIGDFNFDGALDSLDWPFVRDNYNSDHAGLTPYDAYVLGDINRDGLTDLRDFIEFKDAFTAINGPGSFEAMLSNIPEPSHAGLLLFLPIVTLIRANQTRRKPR